MEGYIFEEQYRHEKFEQEVRERMSYGVGFYLRGKYIFQDAFEEAAAGKIADDDVFMYCPKQDEVFEIDKSCVETPKTCCHQAAYGVSQPNCPFEASCEQCCRLKNAVYEHKGLNRVFEAAFYQKTNKGIVLRAFTVTVDFSGERYELHRQGEFRQTEWLRIFYNADRSTEIYSKKKIGYSGNGGDL